MVAVVVWFPPNTRITVVYSTAVYKAYSVPETRIIFFFF